MDAALEDLVRRRARFRCEYCLLPEALVSTPFQFDHIIAQSLKRVKVQAVIYIRLRWRLAS